MRRAAFVPVTEKEKQAYFGRNETCFIPGYTGHCPTLRFHYGQSYGSKTQEIISELRDKRVLQDAQPHNYRVSDPGQIILRPLKPIERTQGQTKDYFDDIKHKYPKYIIGYTGFIPTLNFRYGKSYTRTADDSMCEFVEHVRKTKEARKDKDRMYRGASAPIKMKPIRNEDEVAQTMKDYEEWRKFKPKQISPDFPPIAGYTGHIPRIKGSEESLSQRYNVVVKRGLNLLRKERENRDAMKKIDMKITDIVANAEDKLYPYKDFKN
ncbi:ciliary microtubule inner protein 2B-like [Onthophagus taurus]|uniref:ciliary microtubule inner protein 2B-like n=1 Tax=Onthophagus taurus TaxID=166361 RepID=UPI0039BDB7D6